MKSRTQRFLEECAKVDIVEAWNAGAAQADPEVAARIQEKLNEAAGIVPGGITGAAQQRTMSAAQLDEAHRNTMRQATKD